MSTMAGMSKQHSDTIEKNGVVYTLSPIEFGDIAEMEMWCRNSPLRDYKELIEELGDLLPASERSSLLQGALEERKKLKVDMQSVLGTMKSAAAMKQWFFLSLRHKHPDITEKEVGDLMGPVSRAQEIMSRFSTVLGIDDMDPTKLQGMLGQLTSPGEQSSV